MLTITMVMRTASCTASASTAPASAAPTPPGAYLSERDTFIVTIITISSSSSRRRRRSSSSSGINMGSALGVTANFVFVFDRGTFVI